MKVLCIIQARLGSSRLPGKVLLKIGNKSLIEIMVERLSKSKSIEQLVLAISDSPADDELYSELTRIGVDCVRGSENNVLDRFYQAAKGYTPEYVVRLTGDCPLIDPKLVDQVVQFTIENELDYGTNTLERFYPDGQDIEVFKYDVLVKAWNEASLGSEKEHVTPYIWKNSTYKGGDMFTSKNFCDHKNESLGGIRMTVDEPEDFKVIQSIIEEMGTDKTWKEYSDYLLENKEIRSINMQFETNEGYKKSLNEDERE